MPDSLDRKECSKMYGGDKLIAKGPRYVKNHLVWVLYFRRSGKL